MDADIGGPGAFAHHRGADIGMLADPGEAAGKDDPLPVRRPRAAKTRR
jgi:hypothetical protein